MENPRGHESGGGDSEFTGYRLAAKSKMVQDFLALARERRLSLSDIDIAVHPNEQCNLHANARSDEG